MKNILSILFIALILAPNVSFAEKYEVSANQWSFDLITDTCGAELREALEVIGLPADIIITYPKTISDKYFSIELKEPGSNEVSKYEFEYWTDYDEHLVCTGVEPMGFLE